MGNYFGAVSSAPSPLSAMNVKNHRDSCLILDYDACNAALKLTCLVSGNVFHLSQTNSAFLRRLLTWAKLDLSFVAEKKLDLGFSTLKKGRYRGGVSLRLI